MDMIDIEHKLRTEKSIVLANNIQYVLTQANRICFLGEDFEVFSRWLAFWGEYEVYCMETEEDIKELRRDDVLFLGVLNRKKVLSVLNAVIRNPKIELTQVILPEMAYMKAMAEFRGTVIPFDKNKAQLPFLATIDIVDTCNLQCRTCPHLGVKNSGDQMDFDLFCRILDKLDLMGIKQVELYNYTEPFLHPDFLRFATEVKRHGFDLGISSNLALPDIQNLKECVDLLEGNDWFVVTISGITQEVYGINHVGGKIKNVIHNLEKISQSENSKHVCLRMLKFDYNLSEVSSAKQLADKYNMSFQWFPAIGSPFLEVPLEKRFQKAIKKGISLKSAFEAYNTGNSYCKFIHSRNIVIDCHGNVELCCQSVARPYHMGSFLEQDISLIQLRRELSPMCYNCAFRNDGLKDFPLD